MRTSPHRAQSVTVSLQDGGPRLGAWVDDADEEVLTLVLNTPPSSGLALRGSAVIEYTTPRGIHRISGALVTRPGRPEVLEVRRDHHDDVVQRRDFVRVDVVVPVHVTVEAPTKAVVDTVTRNLSAGGMMFVDALHLQSGTEIEFAVEIVPGSARVLACGTVVREIAKGLKGVRIDSIAHDDRERLVRFVFERERLALKVARSR